MLFGCIFQYNELSVKALCQQYGTLQAFYPALQYHQAIVFYKNKEDAAKAQKNLEMSGAMTAELVPDSEVQSLLESLGLWDLSKKPMTSGGGGGGGGGNSQWNGTQTSNVWSSSGAAMWEDNALLPGNLLGQ